MTSRTTTGYRTNLASIAIQLDQAEASGSPIEQFNDSLSIEDAYYVQKKLLSLRRERGEQITGAKLGFTSKAKMEQMGVSEVIAGFLTDRMLIESGSKLSLSHLVHPRVEPEIAFRFGQEIQPGADLDEIIGSIDAVAPALEIIDSRYRNFSFSLSDVVADNTSACRYTVGEWVDFNTNLAGHAVTMLVDGTVVETGSTSAILGDPMLALEAFARMNQRHGTTLPVGSVLLAGAATAAIALVPSSRVTAVVAGLGTIELEISGAEA